MASEPNDQERPTPTVGARSAVRGGIAWLKSIVAFADVLDVSSSASLLGAVMERLEEARSPPSLSPAGRFWEQPGGSLLDARRRGVTVVVVFLFAGVFCLGLLIDDAAWVPFLYTLPVALAAVLSGVRAGLAAGTLAVLLSVLAGTVAEAPISVAGYIAYIVLFLLVGCLNGAYRDKPLRVLPLYSVLLPIGILVLVLNSMFGSIGSLTSAPNGDGGVPSPQFQPVAVQQGHVSQPSQVLSTVYAVTSALSGDLPSSYQLGDVGAANDSRYTAALHELDSHVSNAKATDDETAVLANELASAVRAGDIRASAVIEVLDAYDDPGRAVRGLHDAYLSALARLTQFADSLEPVADGVEAILEERARQRKVERESEATRRATGG